MLPGGYTKLEYIESSGTQYVDTGFQPTTKTKLTMSVQLVGSFSKVRALFGGRKAAESATPYSFTVLNTSATAIRSDWFGSSKSLSLNSVTERMTVVDDCGTLTADGQELVHTAVAADRTVLYSLYLLAVNTAGAVSYYSAAKLYSCKIEDNSTPVRDFVPCTNASGETGLYDLVNGIFYGNAGAGAFVAGPAVETEPSIQETNLRAIADAIREKEGSTGGIAAEDFAARILALQDSASGYSMPLRLETNPGASVTAQNGENVLTGTADEDGNLTFLLPKPGTWTVTAALDGREKTRDVTVEDYALNFASRLPEGYQEVKYIHTVTATSFNSDISVTSSNVFRTFRVVMDFEADTYTGSASQVLFNSTNFSYVSGSKFAYQVFRNSASQLAYYLGNASAVAYASINISNTRLMFDCDMAEQTFKVGSDVFTFGAATGTLKTWTPVLFASPSGGNAIPGKLYAAKMWLSGELVRDFVPCIDPSGVVGLYDLVNGVFYKNSRNGALTAGPAV